MRRSTDRLAGDPRAAPGTLPRVAESRQPAVTAPGQAQAASKLCNLARLGGTVAVSVDARVRPGGATPRVAGPGGRGVCPARRVGSMWSGAATWSASNVGSRSRSAGVAGRDQPGLVGDDDQLGAVPRAQLGHRPADVRFGRCPAASVPPTTSSSSAATRAAARTHGRRAWNQDTAPTAASSRAGRPVRHRPRSACRAQPPRYAEGPRKTTGVGSRCSRRVMTARTARPNMD
jgi:hypothetical protein